MPLWCFEVEKRTRNNQCNVITWSGTLLEEVWTPKTALCADSAGAPEPSVSLVVADIAEVVEDPLDSVDASGVCCKVGRKASASHCKVVKYIEDLATVDLSERYLQNLIPHAETTLFLQTVL